jgi:hypothetical protein
MSSNSSATARKLQFDGAQFADLLRLAIANRGREFAKGLLLESVAGNQDALLDMLTGQASASSLASCATGTEDAVLRIVSIVEDIAGRYETHELPFGLGRSLADIKTLAERISLGGPASAERATENSPEVNRLASEEPRVTSHQPTREGAGANDGAIPSAEPGPNYDAGIAMFRQRTAYWAPELFASPNHIEELVFSIVDAALSVSASKPETPKPIAKPWESLSEADRLEWAPRGPYKFAPDGEAESNTPDWYCINGPNYPADTFAYTKEGALEASRYVAWRNREHAAAVSVSPVTEEQPATKNEKHEGETKNDQPQAPPMTGRPL